MPGGQQRGSHGQLLGNQRPVEAVLLNENTRSQLRPEGPKMADKVGGKPLTK